MLLKELQKEYHYLLLSKTPAIQAVQKKRLYLLMAFGKHLKQNNF